MTGTQTPTNANIFEILPNVDVRWHCSPVLDKGLCTLSFPTRNHQFSQMDHIMQHKTIQFSHEVKISEVTLSFLHKIQCVIVPLTDEEEYKTKSVRRFAIHTMLKENS